MAKRETALDSWDKLYNNQKAFHSRQIEQKNLIDNYFFIFDCINNNILFTNVSFETLTGYDASTFNIEKLLEIIHPDDLPYFYKCEETGLNFTNGLTFNEHYQYLMSYSYRIIAKNGEVIHILQQCQAIEVNNQGNLSKTLVMHKKIAPYTERAPNDYKIFDKARNIYIDSENCYNLSKRELNILELIKAGKSTMDISKELNISKHTVDTHRKNILKKTNSATFIDLIRKISFNIA